MLTEFEVRQRVAAIRASRLAPLRKARLLLKIGKSLSEQAARLTRARAQISLTADRKSQAGMTRMATSTQTLEDDVREAAYEALQNEKTGNPYVS
jgi:hypothetical protein